MSHFAWNQPVALTVDPTTTPEVGWNSAKYGQVFVPEGSPITLLTFYTSDDPDGTFLPLNRCVAGALSAVTLTVAVGKAVPLPVDLCGCRAMKMVANAPGTVRVSFHW